MSNITREYCTCLFFTYKNKLEKYYIILNIIKYVTYVIYILICRVCDLYINLSKYIFQLLINKKRLHSYNFRQK